MAPAKLPRYVMFKGDNGLNLCLSETEGHPYLYFNSTNRDLWGSHEVIPVPGKEGVVMVKSLYNQNFWRRRSSSWIWADKSGKPLDSDLDCLFKVVQISSQKVALQSLANSHYVKRFTHDGKTSALNAAAPDYSTDVHARMEVSEALSTRRVFDVEYLWDLLQTTDMKPLDLGSATAKNSSNSNEDLPVTVTYEVSETSTWSDSTTFTTGLSVTVTAGIPNIASTSSTVSPEFSYTTEMGKENEKTKTVSITYTIKDAKPHEEVTLRVLGTKATGTVPYKYKFEDTLLDGSTLAVDTGVDGIFKGVQVVNFGFETTDSSGTRKSVAKLMDV